MRQSIDYILTMRGWVSSKKVTINDYVLTHKNRWQPVISKTVTYFDELAVASTPYSFNAYLSEDLCIMSRLSGAPHLPKITANNDNYKLTMDQWETVGENYFAHKSNTLLAKRAILSSNLLSISKSDLSALVKAFHSRIDTLNKEERLFLLCAHLKLFPLNKISDKLNHNTITLPKPRAVVVLEVAEDRSWYLNGLCVSF